MSLTALAVRHRVNSTAARRFRTLITVYLVSFPFTARSPIGRRCPSALDSKLERLRCRRKRI